MAETSQPYSENIAKWGRFARAVLAKEERVARFKGIKRAELEAVSQTEAKAEAADRAQKDAQQKILLITEDIQKTKALLLDSFEALELRLPNVALDLEKAGDRAGAKAAEEVRFSTRAIPRPPRDEGEPEAPEEALEAAEEEAPEPEEEEEEPKPREDRESRAQGAIADAALRMHLFLTAKQAIVQALLEREMPETFLSDLKANGEALHRLREERVLGIVACKRATRAEHKAVAEHIAARGVIEPTATKLATRDDEIDALMVEHLKRMSAQAKKAAKRAGQAKKAAEKPAPRKKAAKKKK